MDLVGGHGSPEAVTFRKFCMSKRNNLVPWGGVHWACPPLDLPMHRYPLHFAGGKFSRTKVCDICPLPERAFMAFKTKSKTSTKTAQKHFGNSSFTTVYVTRSNKWAHHF